MTWKIIEIALGKTMEQIVDAATGKWLCRPCSAKMKYFSEKAILDAAREKAKHGGENVNKEENW